MMVQHLKKYGESSGNSDLSDMENTPAPKMISYKNARPALSMTDLLRDKLGKDATDLLTLGLGLSHEESPSKTTPKRVSFSPHNELHDLRSDQGCDTPLRPF